MKQNKKTNKFKLVKWKKKLAPTLFGTFISLNPLMIIALKDDKSSKSSSQSADRNSVENEKTRIQGLSKQTITKSVIKVNANSLTAQEIGIDKDKIEGVKHTITHKEVTSDTNDLDVSIDIKKGSQTLTTTMKVKIIGINLAKAKEKALQVVNNLVPSDFLSVYDSEDRRKGTINAINTNSAKKHSIIKVIQDKITNTYSEAQKLIIEDLISFDISLIMYLKIEINLKPLGGLGKKIITLGQEKVPNKSYLNNFGYSYKMTFKWKRFIFQKYAIRKWFSTKKTIYKYAIKVNANSLTTKDLGINANKNKDFKYEIIHKEVINDTKELDILIKIKKDNITYVNEKIKVAFIIINKEKLNKDIKAIKALFNSLENPSDGKYATKSTLKDASTTLPSELSSQTTPETIGFKDPSKNRRNGVNVLFKVKSYDDDKGTLVVQATISKNLGLNQTIEFTLTGYQTQVKRIASNKQDIEKEKVRIEKLDRVTINKLLSSINKNSLTKSELALGETPKGLSYEIIHDKITREGEFDITLKIKKGSQAIKSARKVLISFPKTSSLSKGDIAGIVIGVSLVTFVIIFIIYKFLKFKKIKISKLLKNIWYGVFYKIYFKILTM